MFQGQEWAVSVCNLRILKILVGLNAVVRVSFLIVF